MTRPLVDIHGTAIERLAKQRKKKWYHCLKRQYDNDSEDDGGPEVTKGCSGKA
jgi:hypothetical protein